MVLLDSDQSSPKKAFDPYSKVKSIRLEELFDEKWNKFRKKLEGELLTLIEAIFTDREQREAIKSTIRRTIQDNFFTTYWQIISYFESYQKSIGENVKNRSIPSEGWHNRDYLFKNKK